MQKYKGRMQNKLEEGLKTIQQKQKTISQKLKFRKDQLKSFKIQMETISSNQSDNNELDFIRSYEQVEQMLTDLHKCDYSSLISSLFVQCRGLDSTLQNLENLVLGEDIQLLKSTPRQLNIQIEQMDICNGIIENASHWFCVFCHSLNQKNNEQESIA